MEVLLKEYQRVADARRRANSGNSPAWTLYAWKLERIFKQAWSTYALLDSRARTKKEIA